MGYINDKGGAPKDWVGVYPTFLYPILGIIWIDMIRYETKSPIRRQGFYWEVNGISLLYTRKDSNLQPMA